MFHATAYTGAKSALREKTVPLRQLGPRAFAVLVGAELLLLVGVLVWALSALVPPATPLAAPQLTPVEDAIRARVGGAIDDPLIDVAPGHSARASNVRGFSLSGQTYYYYIEGVQNYDPLSRGAVKRGEVEILFRDSSGPMPFVVYRIL